MKKERHEHLNTINTIQQGCVKKNDKSRLILLEKISILNKFCSFELLLMKQSWKKIPNKLSSTIPSNINNKSYVSYV